MAGEEEVDMRDGVGCRSEQSGPSGQWPSR